jgi:tRNA(Ile)-lysidine synthase
MRPPVAIENIALRSMRTTRSRPCCWRFRAARACPGWRPCRRWVRGAWRHRPLAGGARRGHPRWLRARGEPWVEDPSNADERFTRNRIRARLLPAIEAVFPRFARPLPAVRPTPHRRSRSCELARRTGGRCAAPPPDRRASSLVPAAPGQRAAPLAAPGARHQRPSAARNWMSCWPTGRLHHARPSHLHLKVGRGFVRGRAPRLGGNAA